MKIYMAIPALQQAGLSPLASFAVLGRVDHNDSERFFLPH